MRPVRSQQTVIPPLFWCAHCGGRIDTVRGIVLCQGTAFCCHACHQNDHRHEEDRVVDPCPECGHEGTHKLDCSHR